MWGQYFPAFSVAQTGINKSFSSAVKVFMLLNTSLSPWRSMESLRGFLFLMWWSLMLLAICCSKSTIPYSMCLCLCAPTGLYFHFLTFGIEAHCSPRSQRVPEIDTPKMHSARAKLGLLESLDMARFCSKMNEEIIQIPSHGFFWVFSYYKTKHQSLDVHLPRCPAWGSTFSGEDISLKLITLSQQFLSELISK